MAQNENLSALVPAAPESRGGFYMTWLLTVLSLIGVIANIKRRRWCFGIWTVTNCCWMVIDYRAGLYAQAALFFVYFVLAIWGLAEWRRKC